MVVDTLDFEVISGGRPYQAALIPLGPRQPDWTAMHRHRDYWEMFYVVSGRGSHQLDAWAVPLERGDLALIRPFDEHTFSGGPGGLAFINVTFPTPKWNEFLGLIGRDRLLADWERAPTPPHVHLRAQAAETAEAAFTSVLERYQAGAAFVDVVRLWCDAISLLALSRDGTEVSAECPAWLEEACAAMREESNLHAGLERLRELASVSPGYLARAMKEHYATTPIDYVNRVRLERAAMLLTTTQLSVAEVARRMGYTSQSYFGRCFRASYGVSPRSYRDRDRRAALS